MKVYEAIAPHRVTILYDVGTTHERRGQLVMRRQAGSPGLISPTGYSWGYGGSGPAQLALDLLWDVYGQEPSAGLLQKFKLAKIATPHSGTNWRLTEDEIRTWVDANGGFSSGRGA